MGAALAGSAFVAPTRADADSGPVDAADLALLRKTFELASWAREVGGAPYGALVADVNGDVVAEQGNTSSLSGGDPTQHAEMMALAAGWRKLGYDGMNSGTLYASTEPCSMCAGAAYWSGIGRVVYGLSNTRLFEFTRDNPLKTSFALPCREILQNGQRPVTVVGPLLEDEAGQAHVGYWR
jgi:tRNA(Arg) A34 adenosine deaminase TadA